MFLSKTSLGKRALSIALVFTMLLGGAPAHAMSKHLENNAIAQLDDKLLEQYLEQQLNNMQINLSADDFGIDTFAQDTYPEATGLVITPNGNGSDTVLINPNRIIQFSAFVQGTNNPPQDVSWSYTYGGSAFTLIDSGSGVLQIGSDHSTSMGSNSFTVTATSSFNPDVKKSITVEVISGTIPEMNNINGVTIPEQNLSVAKGYPIVLSAIVLGVGNPTQTITWTVSGNTSSDTRIESNSAIGVSGIPGRLFVGEDETSPTLTVTAACGSYADTATITITEPPSTLAFTDDSAFDIPESTIGTAIANIDLSNAVSGGTPPYKFSGKFLPLGISISEGGVISGTPTALDNNGGWSTITVTDSAWPINKRQSKEIDIDYGVISEPDAPIENTLVAKPVLAWMGNGLASDAGLFASDYKLSWTFNNHYISATSEHLYSVRIFNYDDDITQTTPVKDTGVLNTYDVTVVPSSLTISRIMDLSDLAPSTRSKTTGEFIPNYKMVVDAYHPNNTDTSVATCTVDVIHAPLGLRVYDKTANTPTATLVGEAGDIMPIEVDIFGIWKSEIENGTDAVLKYEVKKNDGDFQDFTSSGLFEQLPESDVKAAGYPTSSMTGYKCKAVLGVTVPTVNSCDTYTCRFTFSSGGESIVFEKTIYTINPEQGMTLTLRDTLGIRETRSGLYDPNYKDSEVIALDNQFYITPTGSAQQISDSAIQNLSHLTLDRSFELTNYPSVMGEHTNFSQEVMEISAEDKSNGVDYISKLSWGFTNLPNYRIEVTVKAKLLTNELYFFSVPDNTKTYELTYNEKSVTLTPRNNMIAVYEPNGITTDVLITTDNSNVRATVANSKLLSGEDTYSEMLTFNRSQGFRTPRINRPSFANYTIVKAYLKGQSGESLQGKNATVNVALVNGEGVLLSSEKAAAQAIGLNGLIAVPTLAHSAGEKYIIEVIVDGYDPVLKYIPAVDVGSGIPFSKLPVFILYKEGTSPDMLTGIYEEKQPIMPNGYIIGYDFLNRIDLTTIPQGQSVQYDHQVFSSRKFVEITLVVDAKKVGDNPSNPQLSISGGNILLADGTNKSVKVTNLRDNYSFLDNDYYQYSLSLKEGFQTVNTSATPILTCGALQLKLPLFSYCALTPEQMMERELRNLRLEGEREAKLDALKDKGLDGNIDKLFENFSVSLPSGLPFTFNLEKKGNEYIVRGILSLNLIPVPGGSTWAENFGGDAAESFESLFNEIMAEVINAKSSEEARAMLRLQLTQASAFGGVRGYLSGKAVYDAKSESFVVSFNDGGVIAEASGGITVEAFSPFTPHLVFGLSAEGLAKLDMRIKAPTATELSQAKSGAVVRVNLEQENTLEASITVNTGVGMPDIIPTSFSASAGGYAQASAGSNMLTVIRPYMGGKTSSYVRYYVEGELGLYWKVGLGPVKIGQFYPLLEDELYVYSPDNEDNPYKPNLRRAMLVPVAQTAQANVFSQPQIIADANSVSQPRYANSYLFHDEGSADYGDEVLKYHRDDNSEIQVGTLPTYDYHSQTGGGVTSVLAQTLNMSEAEFEELNNLNAAGNIEGLAAQIDALKDRFGMHAYILNENGETLKSSALTYLPNSMNLNPKTAINGDSSIYVWKSGSMIQLEAMEDGTVPYSTDLLGALVFARGDTSGNFTAVSPITALNHSFQIESYSVSMLADKTALIAANDKDGNIYYYIITADNQVQTLNPAQKGFDTKTAVAGSNFAVTCVTDNGNGGQNLYLNIVDKSGQASHSTIEVPNVKNNYKLAIDGNNLGIFWTELHIGTEMSKSLLKGTTIDMTTFVVGTSQTIVSAPDGKTITGFDCRMTGKSVEAIATYTWFETEDTIKTGIASHSYTFSNNLKTGVWFDYADYAPGRETVFNVVLENSGVLPMTSLKTTINSQDTTFDISTNPLLPGETRQFEAKYNVPQTLSTVTMLDYSVLATFADDTPGSDTGLINTAKTDAAIETLLVEEGESAQTFILGVFNDSDINLLSGQKVKVGLYADALGETLLAPGSETIISRADDLALIDAGGYAARFVHDGPLAEGTYIYALVSVLDAQDNPVYDTSPNNNMVILQTAYAADDPSPGESESGGSSSSAKLNTTTAAFDKAQPKDISVTLSAGDYSLVKITCDGKTLVEGKEYTKNGNTYTFNSDFLSTLGQGAHKIVFDMNGGADPVLTITVTNDGIQAEWQNPFIDVNTSDWFYEAVQTVHQNGVMNGTSANTFVPHGTLNRAMMVQILYNLEGQPASGTTSFSDVDSTLWYAKAIAWAADVGVVNGVGNNLFKPTQEVTREQMATMLHRYCQYKGIELPLVRTTGAFADADIVSDWAKEAVQSMYEAGILNGKGNNIFDPKGTATRAEVAQMLMRFLRATQE